MLFFDDFEKIDAECAEMCQAYKNIFNSKIKTKMKAVFRVNTPPN